MNPILSKETTLLQMLIEKNAIIDRLTDTVSGLRERVRVLEEGEELPKTDLPDGGKKNDGGKQSKK